MPKAGSFTKLPYQADAHLFTSGGARECRPRPGDGEPARSGVTALRRRGLQLGPFSLWSVLRGSTVLTAYSGLPGTTERLTEWDRRCGFDSAGEAMST